MGLDLPTLGRTWHTAELTGELARSVRTGTTLLLVMKPDVSPMEPLLGITHLAAAAGGVMIGVSLCRSRR